MLFYVSGKWGVRMRGLKVVSLFLVLIGVSQSVLAQPKAVSRIWFNSPPEIREGGKLINEGEVEEGIAMIRSVINKGLPLKFQAHGYTNLCGGYLRLQEYTKAIRYCRRAIKFDSTIWQALSNRGAARFALGRYGEAAEDFRRAIKLDPENTALKENLAMAEEGARNVRQH